jgi:uncharacterized membrane protein YGL010W/sterol desaturase/sphingolipid hydroxylase (fatty acid hydroxylase superfamily)
MIKKYNITSAPYPSIPLFQHPLLEKLTHVHPITPLIFWSPIILFFIYLSFSSTQSTLAPVLIVLWSFLGFFVWTLTEYLLHRFIFHYQAHSPWGKKLVYLTHGIHHDDPKDYTRLVMPPLPGLIYASILFYFFHYFIQGPPLYLFFACFLIGYLVYDYTHYAIHHFTPKTRWGKFLRKNHLTHHVHGHLLFGVSSPLWDLIFHTIPRTTPVKTTHQWLTQYALTHQHPLNKRIHYWCVPLIFFSTFGLLYTTLSMIHPLMMVIPLFFILRFYLKLGQEEFLWMATACGLCFSACLILSLYLILSEQIILLLITFTLSWTLQFFGHLKEGKKPAFMDDLSFLLIGPLWLIDSCFAQALKKHPSEEKEWKYLIHE